MNQLNTQILDLARKNLGRLDCKKSRFSTKASRISNPIRASALFCQMNFVRRRIVGIDSKVGVICLLTRRNRECGKNEKSGDNNRAAHRGSLWYRYSAKNIRSQHIGRVREGVKPAITATAAPKVGVFTGHRWIRHATPKAGCFEARSVSRFCRALRESAD
jgi:hypothetical protein